MNLYELTFLINDNNKIIIPLEDRLDSIGWGYTSAILLNSSHRKLTLANAPIYFDLQDMKNLLSKALVNKLQLPPSINTDIGYLFNGYCKNENGFPLTNLESGISTWVGNQYQLWYTYENEKIMVTWIYNNTEGEIVFEVTPSYPYFNCDIQKQKHFTPFRKWMLKYKPYFTAKLSKKIALQWLDQVNQIIETIDDNEKR